MLEGYKAHLEDFQNARTLEVSEADRKHVVATVESRNYGQTQFVPAGEYKVTISVGDWKDQGTLEVKPAPNATYPPTEPAH